MLHIKTSRYSYIYYKYILSSLFPGTYYIVVDVFKYLPSYDGTIRGSWRGWKVVQTAANSDLKWLRGERARTPRRNSHGPALDHILKEINLVFFMIVNFVPLLSLLWVACLLKHCWWSVSVQSVGKNEGVIQKPFAPSHFRISHQSSFYLHLNGKKTGGWRYWEVESNAF